MNITSFGFLLFLALTAVVYYTVSSKLQWKVLLFASLIYVILSKPAGAIFIAFSCWSIWLGGLQIQKIYSDHSENHKGRGPKAILLLVVLSNLLILLLLKYIGDYAGRLRQSDNIFSLLIPIGLSYYTLQAIGYILDVYWKRIPAESSYLKILLFLSYFPQMLQGPISRYGQLSVELLQKPHPFQIHNLKFGVQRMLWGYFKVLGVAGFMGQLVSNAFYDSATAYGFAAFLGLVFFGFQLYANFSGGIDLVIGASQCLGVQLPENFQQPFFSKSLGEFWRRWHITLGTWMKDYVFFPFYMSRFSKKLKKALKNHVSKKTSNRISMALANLVVFLLVGIWHGTGTNYALWGLYNGVILAGSELLADVFLNAKQKLRIREEGGLWNAFRYARTFLIITLGWCTDCAATAGGSFRILLNMLRFSSTNLYIFGIGKLVFLQICIFLGTLMTVEILHERNKSVRMILNQKPIALQLIFWALFLQFCIFFGNTGANGGLMYANF